MVCLYELLGVDRTSSQKEIAKAYRLLAIKHHPDKITNCNEDEKACKQLYRLNIRNILYN